MFIYIQNFRGQGAREAKAAIYRHFKNTARENWHYIHGLDPLTHTAVYGGTYLSRAWTGRINPLPQFPLWLWKRVAAIKHRPLSNWLLARMKCISGLR